MKAAILLKNNTTQARENYFNTAMLITGNLFISYYTLLIPRKTSS